MRHKPWKLLLSPWTTSLAFVTLFTLATDGKAQEILQPYAPPILHPTFAFPTSVAVYKNRLLVVSSQFDTAGSPAAVSGTQPLVVPFWVTEMRERIVTTIPLEFIWTDEEQLEASRERYLTQTDITEMLKMHPVEFIVADVGAPLKRISVDRCYEFWKSEVKRHLLNPHGKLDLSRLPDEYGYVASEWSGNPGVPIVLLEKIH